MRHVLDCIGSIMVATYGWYIRKRMDPILAILSILETCWAILPQIMQAIRAQARGAKASQQGLSGTMRGCWAF